MSLSISLINLLPANKRSLLYRLLLRLLDHLTGVAKMDQLYQQHHMQGLSKEAFAAKLLTVLQVEVTGIKQLQQRLPTQGPLVIASNHPFGGLEGVILSLFISQLRPDLKVLANQGLRLFPELQDYFIFTNPLSERDPKNGPSLRTSIQHLKQGGALLIFPAGRVSYYQQEKQRISEHHWNRTVAGFINRCEADFIAVFTSGYNSRWFYRVGRLYQRLRMLMLAHEVLNKKGAKVQISSSQPVKPTAFNQAQSLQQQAAVCRLLSYAQDPQWRYQWPADPVTKLLPLADEIAPAELLHEIQQLPAEQHLLDHSHYSVYFGYQQQIPKVVTEIARLRELVFREHNEGSGQPVDTDAFDGSYTHLFVFNNKSNKIIGAYRMGQTDKLLAEGDNNALYLSRMFNFGQHFVNQQQPCLEMGRSFLIPEYQRSFQGLFLLWRGIGAFVGQYPQYRILYGTVSLSKLYDPRSVAIIERALVDNATQADPRDKVKPHKPFPFSVHPEIAEFAQQQPLSEHLNALLASIEADGKGIPILLKHYMKLGANFHCLGIDGNFNDTPGLLLSVNLAKAPAKMVKMYLREKTESYLSYPD